MVDGRYATYQGQTFRVSGVHDGYVRLVTEDAASQHLGFEAKTYEHTAHTLYIKEVPREDIEEVYDIRLEARYEGVIFDLFSDVDGQWYIGTSDSEKGEAYQLLHTDKYYYSKPVKETEFERILHRSSVEL